MMMTKTNPPLSARARSTQLAEIVDSAVYLDDESFENASIIEEKDKVIAELRSRIKDLAHELERRNVALSAARTGNTIGVCATPLVIVIVISLLSAWCGARAERSQAERRVGSLEAHVKELVEQIQSKDTVLKVHMEQLQAKHGEIESKDVRAPLIVCYPAFFLSFFFSLSPSTREEGMNRSDPQQRETIHLSRLDYCCLFLSVCLSTQAEIATLRSKFDMLGMSYSTSMS